MPVDKSLLDEIERSRRLVRDSGLNETLRNPAIQNAIESLGRASMPALSAASEMVRDQNMKWLLAFQKPMADSLHRMLADSAMLHVKHLTKIQNDLLGQSIASALNAAGLDSARTLKEQFRAFQSIPFDKLLKPTVEIEGLLKATQSIVGSSQVKLLASIGRSYEDMLRNYPIESMRAAFQASEFIRQNFSISHFPDSFASELISKLPFREDENIDEVSYEDYQERVATFFTFFIQAVRNLDRGWINAMAIINFVFLFAIPIYQYYDNKQAEVRNNEARYAQTQELKQEIQNSKHELLSEIERSKPVTPEPTFYVVERRVSLRLGATAKSPRVAILPPNQLVALQKRKGRWIYIEFFDYIEGVTRTGWAAKKYLKIVTKH